MPKPTRDGPRETRGRLAYAVDNADRLWYGVERYIQSKLVWNNVFRAVSYLRSALWTIPLLAIVVVLIVAPVLRVLDPLLGWRLVGLGPAGAQALYQTVITLTLSFLVFTFGSLLVAIQVASGQLTPRIIATALLRDNVVRYSVGLFVFTLVFAVMALNRLERTVYEIVAAVVAALGIACMVMFLFLIDYAARLLRPVSILARIGDEGRTVIAAVYPALAGDTPDVAGPPPELPDAPRRVILHEGRSENILAVDLDTVVREAQRAGGVVELVPQVGDFLATYEPLFVLYGGATAIDDTRLRTTVAFGPERTMEQDPLFSFRIMVDIALKALSPAINDPTTAVLAIDQIHRLLRVVGKRQLRGEQVTDRSGQLRLIYRTPNWEDFVHVSCVEIRACGAGSVQIARRLRAMLDNLIGTLPPYRQPPLQQERQHLEQMVRSLYSIPEDAALAAIPDVQGLGGSSAARAPIETELIERDRPR